MDFDSDINAAQQVLLRSAYVSKKLTEDEKLQTLCEQMTAVLNGAKDYNQQNIFLFILLNSDADYVDIVAEDENFSHLIDTIPRLSHALILRVILGSGGLLFLQDLVAFAPPTISLTVMETLHTLTDLKQKPQFAITELANACFHKLFLCNGENMETVHKFLTFFKLCQSENFEWMRLINEVEWKARRVIHNLRICVFCMKENYEKQCDTWNGFMIKSSKDEMNNCSINGPKLQSVEEVITECRNIVIEQCVGVLQELTIDDWLEMAEFELDCYQDKIRNLAYEAKEFLEHFEDHKNLVDFTPLFEVLEPFAVKPHREEEKESSPDIQKVRLMLSNNATKSQKWMKEFLNFSCVLEDSDNFIIIENNCGLLDCQDVEHLLEKIISYIGSENVNEDVKERLKCLHYKVVKVLPPEKLAQVHKNFMEKYGLSTILRCTDFTALLRSAFNRTTFKDQESVNEWQCEFIALSMMDFGEFLREALLMALENTDLTHHLSRVFNLMRPMSEKMTPDLIFEMSQKLTYKPNKLDNFPVLVQQLVEHKVLCGEVFFKKYVTSAINEAIDSNNWSSVYMWITTIDLLVPFFYSPGGSCTNVVILILYLLQVMEFSQQQIDIFSKKCIQTREKTISILEQLKTFDLNEAESSWLKSYGFEYSMLTKCYLEQWCSTEATDSSFAATYELCFNSHVKTTETAAFILFEMLPSLCAHEWKGIASVLKQHFTYHDDPAYSIFQSFSQAIFLLLSACSKIDYEVCPNYLLCLNYSVSCFAVILKLKVLPELKTPNYVKVLEESLHLLSQFPAEVWSRGGMDILPDVMSLIGQIPLELENFNQLSSIVSKAPLNEGSTLLKNRLKTVFEGIVGENGEKETTG
ncbi:uncharacterized protein LOC113202973 isoform X2 [Frankliniella occidentalis]|uniref:Uncharacterized protein LOC113202973 isoform X1 n=1 Tax=Frankliniella occidentalis TaxID=133901 RepID=A0A6J1RWM8_FRAOC|nr:uncharacterized protein LOC113202973 isoform X1 [Frankliniella occidentalis]XP_052125648.1 uncharacterized protein LOC113202973 isoform X2 [Frankliniella occidentalis]